MTLWEHLAQSPVLHVQSQQLKRSSFSCFRAVLLKCFSFEDTSRSFCEVDIKAETIAKAETGWSVPVSTNQMGKVAGIYTSPLHSSTDNYSFALQLCILSFHIIGSKPASKFFSVVRGKNIINVRLK